MEFWFVSSKLVVSKLFNQSKGVILFIIIGDVFQFIYVYSNIIVFLISYLVCINFRILLVQNEQLFFLQSNRKFVSIRVISVTAEQICFSITVNFL